MDTTTPVTATKNQTDETSDTEIEYNYIEAVAHLSTSYENAQRTIRFLDTKATGILVFITSLVGVTGLLAKWSIDTISKKLNQFDTVIPHNGMQWTTAVSVILMIVFLAHVYCSIRNALNCLDPQTPKDATQPESLENVTTVLFPCIPKKATEIKDQQSKKQFEEHLQRFLKGQEHQLAKEEFASQIRLVAVIVNGKLLATKKAMTYLRRVLISCVCFSISSVTVYAAANGLFG